MRVATFNILHGRSPYDGRVDLARLAAAVRRLDPDILALQEVDRGQPRSGHADLTAVAAEAMGAVAHRFVEVIPGVPGGRPGAGAPAGGYGLALLSRSPVRRWTEVALPRLPARVPVTVAGTRRLVVVTEEPRAAVLAEIASDLGTLTVATTHLTFLPGWNRLQLRRVVRALRGTRAPRLVLGDLNMPLRAAQRWTGMRALVGGDTFPVDRPRRQLDHVLTDDPGLVATASAIEALPLSDHRAVWVDVVRR